MKTVIKTSIVGPFLRPYFILTAIALGFLALSPRMQAVSPPRMAAIRGQYSGGAGRSFRPDHWPGEYSSWFVFA